MLVIVRGQVLCRTPLYANVTMNERMNLPTENQYAVGLAVRRCIVYRTQTKPPAAQHFATE